MYSFVENLQQLRMKFIFDFIEQIPRRLKSLIEFTQVNVNHLSRLPKKARSIGAIIPLYASTTTPAVRV